MKPMTDRDGDAIYGTAEDLGLIQRDGEKDTAAQGVVRLSLDEILTEWPHDCASELVALMEALRPFLK
jgi:hypothetical protein